MVKQKGYSNEFKNAIVNKLLNRGKSSIAEVCEQEGISRTAAYKWLTCGSIPPMKTKVLPSLVWVELKSATMKEDGNPII